ncbi:hypothetical protein quinque_001019 [Culex quinquefasciatus]
MGRSTPSKSRWKMGPLTSAYTTYPKRSPTIKSKKFMSAYGEILSVRELVWEEKYELAGLKTGVREVKMILKHQIKSFISIEGQHTYVTYIGQQTTCRHCGEYSHSGIPCTQNKKLLLQKVSVNERLKDAKKPTGKSSYADALMTKPSPRFVPAVLVEDNTGMDCDGDNTHTDAENSEITTEGNGSSGGGSGFAAEPGIIIQDGGSSGDANGLADMRQKTTPILQETIIRDGDQLCVFKTPLTLPQDGDGAEESDGSSTSSASVSCLEGAKAGNFLNKNKVAIHYRGLGDRFKAEAKTT